MGDVRHALVEGLRRVRTHWPLALLAQAVSVLLAIPLAALVRQHLADSLGSSLAATRLRDGWDDLWFQAFAAKAEGLATTFQPSVVGVGAILDGLDATVTGNLWTQPTAIAGVGVTYALTWTFLAAGLVGTYVQRETTLSFWARAGQLFPRFLVLAAFGAAIYGMILGVILPQLTRAVDHLNRETIDERIHFAWVAGKYFLVWLAMWGTSLLVDYSRVLSARHPERGVLVVITQTVHLLSRQAPRVFGLSFLVLLGGAALFGVYAVINPGARDSTWVAVLAAFVLSQLYIFGRILLRCTAFATASALSEHLDA